MLWLVVLAACRTEAFHAQMVVISRPLQQYLRRTAALPVLASQTRSSERSTTMAAFPADAGGSKAQRISVNKEKSRQIELAAKVKRAGSVGNWRGVLGLLDTAAFKPDTFV
jgi:hypothetical protein